MSTPRAPGVYAGAEERRFAPISLGPTGVVGFVGLAERGPANEPRRIGSFEEFTDVYGELEAETFLAAAVRGYFSNGGTTAWVLRVAHLVARRREETARAAFVRLADGAGKPTIVLRAASEGVWGNGVRVEVVRQDPRVSTFLTLDLNPGDTSAVIKSTLGLGRGAIIRIRDSAGAVYRVVSDLSGKTVSWSVPLDQGFKSGAPTYIEPVEFTVSAQWRGERERFRNLSMSPLAENYFVRVVGGRSRLLAVQDLRTETPPPENYPVDLPETTLSGGADGLFTVTPEDFIGANIGPGERFGLAALEAVDEVDLLVAPDLMWALGHSSGFRTEKDVQVVQDAMISQCEHMKTRFAILDFPDPKDHRRAGQWRLMFDSAYAAFYYPWIEVESRGRQRLVPPSGHVAGIYARCDGEQGPFRAPANEVIEGAVDLGRALTDADLALMNEAGVNCIRSFPRRGIRVWGARTTSNDPQWRYVPVRRVMNAVIDSVERGLQWAVFETNGPFLWKALTRQVTGFLMDLYNGGYFQGRSPEDAFFVKCDGETNPPESRDVGQVVLECGVAPVRPAEFIVFRAEADAERREDGA